MRAITVWDYNEMCRCAFRLKDLYDRIGYSKKTIALALKRCNASSNEVATMTSESCIDSLDILAELIESAANSLEISADGIMSLDGEQQSDDPPNITDIV